MARMTKRQKEGKKISKQRAARKRRSTLYRRSAIALALAVVFGIGGGLWWLWESGEMQHRYDQAGDALLAFTSDAGFTVRHIYLSGRQHTEKAAVEQAVLLKAGDPIFSLSPREIQERLEALPRVKHATVERVLPDRLYIRIQERTPVAVWQQQKQLRLIDEEGVLLPDEQASGYRTLPLVVGDDAPRHTAALLRMLATEPQLLARVEAAIRVGGRRWNVRFDNGVEIKLPASGAEQAWHRLAEMEVQEKVLQRNIISIDLRIDNHMYIKVPPGMEMPNNKSNKEIRA